MQIFAWPPFPPNYARHSRLFSCPTITIPLFVINRRCGVHLVVLDMVSHYPVAPNGVDYISYVCIVERLAMTVSYQRERVREIVFEIIGLATNWLRILSIPRIDKIRN